MSRTDAIRHPGPRGIARQHVVPGTVRRVALRLAGGRTLMDAVAEAVAGEGGDSAMLVLDGLEIGPFQFVMPRGGSPDGIRVAWYSDTHGGAFAALEHAVATVGRKNGAWFLHCHAVWNDDGVQRAGHLLPGDVTIARDMAVTGYIFTGGRFDVMDDAETAFSIFRACPIPTETGEPNAAIMTLTPFEELTAALPALSIDLFGRPDAAVFGIGSLIGADFTDAATMESLFSEVLTLPGARADRLPVHCVDPAGGQFRGTLRPGGAPVLITFELLLVAPDP
ncbi:hypothetical protein L1787_15990 [Acuticoccus sp. M5D2P5]|uniref:hypothetical protein n=1 Tax=Acuticoccus kalidii TaxID=2910977 RepID=UPI001F20D287|nr:hypothetical protein [Acuticoccus kalidii]MCF3934905.1 hypothetical protein [Acuticoccus kalidii]